MKSCIKNVLNYKKPAFWVISIAIILLIVLVLSLTLNPKNNEPDLSLLNKENASNSIEINVDDIADDIVYLIENNLQIIMSSPLDSSRPEDYIDAHRDEYENILKQGDNALNYLLSQFEKGDSNGLRGHIMMQLCKDLLGDGNNVGDKTLSPQEWYNALLIIKETKLPDFKYLGNNPIEKLVYDTEIEQNKNPYRGGFVVVAPKIHAYYEEANKLKVFVTTYSSSYHLYDKTLSVDGGGVTPAAITYVKNEDGSYSLEKYEQAMDGSFFPKSIEDYSTMPISGKKIAGLADKILKHYGDYSDIITLHRVNLIKHLEYNNLDGIMIKKPNGDIEPLR